MDKKTIDLLIKKAESGSHMAKRIIEIRAAIEEEYDFIEDLKVPEKIKIAAFKELIGMRFRDIVAR